MDDSTRDWWANYIIEDVLKHWTGYRFDGLPPGAHLDLARPNAGVLERMKQVFRIVLVKYLQQHLGQEAMVTGPVVAQLYMGSGDTLSAEVLAFHVTSYPALDWAFSYADVQAVLTFDHPFDVAEKVNPGRLHRAIDRGLTNALAIAGKNEEELNRGQ